MPTRPFRWDALPPWLLRELHRRLLAADDQPAAGDPATALRREFGAPPTEAFVQRSWPLLVEVWLGRDATSRRTLVGALRERRLGGRGRPVRTKAEQLEFLAGCRNTASLRKVVLDEFLALGERSREGARTRNVVAKAVAAWRTVEQRLADTLAELPPGAYLVLLMDTGTETAPEGREGRYYVQFAAQEEGLLVAEAVSNAYLSGAHQLDDTARRQLAALGWREPTPEHADNYWREYRQPAPYADVARLAVRTLHEVYGAPHPAFLRYAAGFVDGRPLSFPGLEVPPEAKVVAPGPAPGADLRSQVDAAVAHWLGMPVEQLRHDSDGDIPIRSGSAMVFVRVYDKVPIIEVFSPVLGEVTAGETLLTRLNELMAQLPLVRFIVLGQVVIASVQVVAEPFTAEHLDAAISILGELADNVDDRLQAEFGGRVFFGESVPRRRESAGMVGGYL